MKKHVHCILDLEAMRAFARTGLKSDHLLGLPPFSPEERLAILTDFCVLCRENPYLHLHFPKPDAHIKPVSMLISEGRGICFYPPNTDYRTRELCGEARIVEPEFVRLMRDFFMDELIGRRVLDESESIALLEQIIAGLREDLGLPLSVQEN